MPSIRVKLLTGRSLDQGRAKWRGKFSDEFLQGVAVCMLHPEDMKRIGISDGENIRVAIADRYISESAERVRIVDGYVAEATGRYNMCQAFVAEAQGRIAEMDRYLAEAEQYDVAANTDLVLADRFRAEATVRRNEFHATLENKSEYRRRISSTPVRQPG